METKQANLPKALSDFLWQIIRQELEQEAVDLALVECRLAADQCGGRPVQRIYFWGKEYMAFGFPPVDDKLLVYVSPAGSALLAA